MCLINGSILFVNLVALVLRVLSARNESQFNAHLDDLVRMDRMSLSRKLLVDALITRKSVHTKVK